METFRGWPLKPTETCSVKHSFNLTKPIGLEKLYRKKKSKNRKQKLLLLPPTCSAQSRINEIGEKSLKQTFSQPGVAMLQSKLPRSSPNTVSAIETTMRKRRTKKNVVQNFPTNVEWAATCSRSFSTMCHAIFLCVCETCGLWLTKIAKSY